MGFNLGMAAAAYQGAKAEQRRLREDAFVQAQHDYALANMDEAKSRRGYRDNAAGLEDAQVTARRELLPKQTAVATGALDAQAQDQSLTQQLRPTTDQIANVKATTGLVQAENEKAEADNVAAWTPQRRAANGQAIDESIAGDELRAHDFRQKVFASLYKSGTQEKMPEEDIVARFNAVSHSKMLFPDLHGKEAKSIKRVPKPGGDVLELYDANGGVLMSMPVAQLKAAHDVSTSNGKVITLADGQNAYRTNPDGTVTKLTDNLKTLAPQRALAAGTGVARSSAQERLIARMQDESKATGKTLTTAEALVMLKSDPEKWAIQLDKADERLKFETDPEKRLQIKNENRSTAGARLLGANGAQAGAAPGLSALSPASQAAINAALKPGL